MEQLKRLNNSQRQAVLSNSKEIMLVAGAGTGKTNTIISKIEYLVTKKEVLQSNILAITFTNKAVNEIKERLNISLGSNNVVVNTFHELARTIIYDNDNYKKLGYTNLTIIDDEIKEKTISNMLEITDNFEILNRYGITIKKLMQDFLLIKNNLYIKSKEQDLENQIETLYALYIMYLKNNDLIEIDDLISISVNLLNNDKEILSKYKNRFTHIFIDEYQDINRSQYDLIKLISSKTNILVVGDEDQSIYSWRGSNSKYFKEFQKEYPNCEVIKLEQNYRSTKEILYLAESFIKQNKNRIDKTLITDRTNTIPKILLTNEITKQITYTLTEIQKNKNKYNYNQNVILIRNRNIELITILKIKLVEYNIPYQIIGDYPLYRRKVVKDLISVLRFLENKNNNYHLKRVATNLKFGLGKTFFKILDDIRKNLGIETYFEIIENYNKYHVKKLKRYTNKMEEFINFFDKYNIEKSFDTLIEEIIYDLFYQTKNKDYDYLQEFLKEAREYYKRNGYKTTKEYLDYIQYFKELSTKDKLQIMTMHASKGLEFNNVYILNINSNYPFLYKSNYMKLDKLELSNNNIIEEERRLLYVAMTRAIDNLYIFGDKNSKFIKELNSFNGYT
ncbi:ATP-dependent helicase [Gemella sp. GH3]|uniref:ATP-dependent helicase n=1 Tax=unclassified Gemella TaxID=2624949 RepID=UPI0015D0278A|nr:MULTISPECIES: ATP-dependent helicase [unclassified Gemella]MBF0713374.1 ATP-dependent helicase [Gemella sp. GH3.1]NYS50326.1 ATP-dependent helicase [Gemella sp. GH3]